MQYSQEVLGKKSHADAVAHCKAKCGKDGCTGFFYQEHTSNGHQICGFYSMPVNLKNAGWHGHKDGSQLCFKLPVHVPQWKCMPDKNWVDGMQYSQEVLGRKSHADAVAHCKAKCGKDGCTGFFYQEHTSNGHQICGFYSKPVNLKNAGWHGHKDGSQLCLKVTGPPPRPMPLEGHTCDTVWTDCHGCYSTGGYCGTPSGALGEKGGHTAVAVCHGTSTWHDRCQTHPSPSPNPSPSAGPTPSPSPSSNPGPPPPSPLPPNPGPPPPLNQSPSPSPSPSMSPSPSPSPPESPSKCLSRVTYINYESVAAIDLVHFFYHGGTMNVYDTDKSGFAPHDYARHTRTEVPCSLFISAVRWVDFKHHGWMGRELDYVLSDADGRVKDVLEQHAGYAPLCASMYVCTLMYTRQLTSSHNRHHTKHS